ncbi:helix-turn-helix domain-containing protein [Haloarchaeobius sp. HRN-SO-5]|uniref:helix-turn-helix domain-containing protein n=1 Tax=Haloarchaeobius sp. HRN-SO-5 TaxID=3446118 RepID=UPI003EBA7608
MSSDDATDPDADANADEEPDQQRSTRDRAVEGFDQGLVDLLSWVLDTETRAKIYVYLQKRPGSTSEEIAQGTGLYPSTVREALAELHDEEKVHRDKRESKGAGNNPYEYTAIPPSELVSGVVGQVQAELNTVFNLDKLLDREDDDEFDEPAPSEPVTITVEDLPTSDDEDVVDPDESAGGDGDSTASE